MLVITGEVYHISNMKLVYWSILKYGNITNFVKNEVRAAKDFSQEDVTRNWKGIEVFHMQTSPAH